MGGTGSGHRPAPVLPFVAPPRSLDAVPDPSVPAFSVLLVVLGTLLFANLVAALPGRDAARTPTAPLLRAE